MKKKYTYKPTSSVKYKKGGKNKKKSYKSDGKHYKAQAGFLSFLSEPIAQLFGISNMMDFLGMEDVTAPGFESIYQMGIDQQTGAAGTGAGLAGQVGDITGFDSGYDPLTGLSNLESVNTLQDQIDNIGITRPKKTSTEFMEGIKDSIGQQTTGVLSDIGRTGKMQGIKDVLGSTDQALIQAQEKGAAMDERYQQQLTDIEKFETGQTSQLVGQQAQQQFGADQAGFDLAGDLTAQSAQAGGDLAASAIAGLVDLQGQQAAATADLLSGAFDTILGFFDPFDDFGIGGGEDGMIVATKDKKEVMKAESGAKMQEYEEGAKQDMMPADEADVTPGKFSHEDNPIDIVQDGEKIGEMTGGEAIMPPKDVAEFENLLAEGDKDAVFNKLKVLFNKWEQAAQEHKEKNLDQEAMGGAKMHYKPKSKINYR